MPTLESNHKGLKPEDNIVTERRYRNEYCFKCHGSYAAIAKLTAESTAFQTSTGKAINPHLPASPSHDANVECWRCHKLHKAIEPANYCFKCHHAQVLECGTCHEYPIKSIEGGEVNP